MTKEEFLETYIFKGLENINDGFDGETIKYFTEQDFEKVLDRVEQYGLGVYGIEPWKDGEYYDCKIFENYTNDATDPQWYRKAFQDFLAEGNELQYSASYEVPEQYLQDENNIKRMTSRL
jgi:hypothetical protein